MAIISKRCEYGLRAALYVAGRKGARYVSIRKIAGELGISFHFLTKILQSLTQAGLMVSARGPAGGVALARPPERISLHDIVRALDEDGLYNSCMLGLKGCGARKPCPLHKAWSVERNRLQAIMKRSTLSMLARQIARGELRLSDR